MLSTTTESLHKMLGNKIFSMTYATQSGRLIKRTCQFGVMKHCKTPPKKHKHIINYYDHTKQGYRFANLGDIKAIKQGKINLKSNDYDESKVDNHSYIVVTHQIITREYRIQAKNEQEAKKIWDRLPSLTAKSQNSDKEFINEIQEEVQK